MVRAVQFHQSGARAHVRRLVAGVFVQGKNSNMHKSFTVELEAYIWLQAALLRGSVELIN